jgi:hypothetical protein
MDRRTFMASITMGALGMPAWAREQDSERSQDFTVTVDGASVPVFHAAGGYSFVTFDMVRSVELVVHGPSVDFWDAGVEVLPSRHGIRPRRDAQRIEFRLEHTAQLVITRPGDHSANARMLFIFANVPAAAPPPPGTPGLRYYGPGVYHEHIHVESNEIVFLAEGAIVYGSLNFWNVEHARVAGRGIVIHDGPQNPDDDEGWQHRPEWHGITLHDARDIEVRGITCVVRSRTWMIQLQGCKDVLFDNIKVIGGTRGNANQDGIDWLGCGDTIVRDCFFRCSDDIFAIYGNTGFYGKDVAIPGKDVRNILIERCVLSTSISNVMRVSWQNKVFSSRDITMRDCDVLHMGMGGCNVPFALLAIWDQPAGRGTHENYLFEDIRLESWYSLVQIHRAPDHDAKVRNVRFRHVRAVDQPPLTPSTANVDGGAIRFEKIRYGDTLLGPDVTTAFEPGIQTAAVATGTGPTAAFEYPAGRIAVGAPVRFTATYSRGSERIFDYWWNFGDGTTARGPVVEHVFSDRDGTLLDGSGRFRVQLTVTDARGRKDTIARPVLVDIPLLPATRSQTDAGLHYRFIEGLASDLRAPGQAGRKGVTAGLVPRDLPRHDHYTVVLDGLLDVPLDGGYTFAMTARDGACLVIDDVVVLASQGMQPQVCNTIGSVVQQASGGIGLKRGLHPVWIAYRHGAGTENIALYWQGPNLALQPVAASSLRHRRHGQPARDHR